MKTCFICQTEKPLTEFYRHPAMADGYLGKCKSCAKQHEKDRRNSPEFREKILARDRLRDTQPHRIEARKAYAKTEKGKERWMAAHITWLERNGHKRQAHFAVSNAIRDKRLIKQPCEVCGNPIVQAHHDDYSQPLAVRWLCVPCHNAHHKAEREAARKAKL